MATISATQHRNGIEAAHPLASAMPDKNFESLCGSDAQRLKRRHDYPEPLYIMPRACECAESPSSVSPMTQHTAPLLSEPQGRCPSPSSSSVYSREVEEDNGIDVFTANSQVHSDDVITPNGMATSRRREPRLRVPCDSGIGGEREHMQYDHSSAGNPASGMEHVWEHPIVRMPAVEQQEAEGLGSVFVFGQESQQAKKMAHTEEDPIQKPKKQRWSTHFWPTKTGVECSAAEGSTQDADEVVEISRPKLSRFSRIRNSVSHISASLKQLAGRKRSRDEPEEPAEAEKCFKLARKDSLPPVSRPHAVKEAPTLRTVQWSPSSALSAVLAEPTTPPVPPSDPRLPPTPSGTTWPRPPALFLSDPEVVSLLNTLRQGPATCSKDEVGWTRAERAEFGMYVRAAEDEGWRMDLT